MDTVAQQFTSYYYTAFDSSRADLSSLYRDSSMITREGQLVQGGVAIMDKLTNLPFSKVTHHVDTIDTQPSSETNLVVLVTGRLTVDESPNPLQFTQIFHLISSEGSYFILNDVFRLIYG